MICLYLTCLEEGKLYGAELTQAFRTTAHRLKEIVDPYSPATQARLIVELRRRTDRLIFRTNEAPIDMEPLTSIDFII